MTGRITDREARTERTVHFSRRHERNTERYGYEQVTAATISFENSTQSIDDSGSGLGNFNVGDIVRVEGSASNNSDYIVTTVAAGSLGVDRGVVQESAGNSITLLRVG